MRGGGCERGPRTHARPRAAAHAPRHQAREHSARGGRHVEAVRLRLLLGAVRSQQRATMAIPATCYLLPTTYYRLPTTYYYEYLLPTRCYPRCGVITELPRQALLEEQAEVERLSTPMYRAPELADLYSGEVVGPQVAAMRTPCTTHTHTCTCTCACTHTCTCTCTCTYTCTYTCACVCTCTCTCTCTRRARAARAGGRVGRSNSRQLHQLTECCSRV